MKPFFKMSLTIAGLTLGMNAQSFSGWDANNRPALMDGSYVHNFNRLPTSGELSKRPWTGNYWATHQGGIANRWTLGIENRSSYMYGKRNMGRGVAIENLSPAEKYDLYVGNKNFSLTSYEIDRTGIFTGRNIPEWEGLCHAWAPSTYQYKHPKTVTLNGKNGDRITFYASDVKALLTMHNHMNSNRSRTWFLGSRCNIDNKTRPNDVAVATECRDTNAGAFHIALANQIGLKDESFIIDRTRDLEVWNQPVFKFQSQVLGQRGPSAGADPRTVKEVQVRSLVYYISEEIQTRRSLEVGDYQNHGAYGYAVLDYTYFLELDGNGNIVGGSWSTWERPDFIYKQSKVSFTGYLADLATIYRRSISGSSDGRVEPRNPDRGNGDNRGGNRGGISAGDLRQIAGLSRGIQNSASSALQGLKRKLSGESRSERKRVKRALKKMRRSAGYLANLASYGRSGQVKSQYNNLVRNYNNLNQALRGLNRTNALNNSIANIGAGVQKIGQLVR